MQSWWTTTYYELIKYSRMRSVLILLIALPLVLILLLGSAFDITIKPSKVALYIADQGEMKTSIEQFWNGDAIKPYVHVLDAQSEAEIKNWLQEGIADYGVVVPAQYSELLLAGKQAEWLTYSGRYAEKNIAAAAIVNGYLGNVNMRLAAVKTLGPEALAAFEATPSEPGAANSHLITHTLSSGGSQDFGKTSAMQYYSATYLIMFLLYGGMSSAIALLNQRDSGTLQRIYAIPGSFKARVFGIILGTVFLAILQAVIIVAFTTYVYGVEWGSHLGWIALICLLATTGGAGLSIIVASFTRSRKAMQSLFGIIVFSMTFISGGMVASIDKTIGPISKFTINHWASESLRAIMSHSTSSNVWHDIGVLALIALTLSIIAAIRLPKVVKQHG